MPPGISLQGDFTAGELSPSLLARVDLAKYGKGCRTLRNFLVQSHGPAVKRPGFELLGELPGPAVLLEFVFNNDQAYALIFGERWMRVAVHDGFVLDGEPRRNPPPRTVAAPQGNEPEFTSGEMMPSASQDGEPRRNPYQIASPYTLEQARQLSYAQSADVLFLACQGVPPHRLMRFAHADWRFEAMNFNSPLAAPQWQSRAGTAYSHSLKYPAGAAYFPETDSLGKTVYAPIEEDLYGRTAKAYHYPNIYFVNGAKNSDGTSAEAQLVTPYTYYLTAVDADGKESGLSEGAKITGPSSNNWQGGDYIALNWQAVAGAKEYRIYKSEFGGRPGYIDTAGNTGYQDYNLAPSVSEGAPSYVDPFPDNDFPGTVCLFEQRLVFASTPKRPQTIWMSKSGDYGNFAAYSPLADDSPIELTIASQEVSAANWMVPLRSLILGTPSVEWEIGGEGGGAFTAKTARAAPQSYWGSSLKRAMVIGNVILHISSSGSQVRNLQYDFASDSYGGTDLSILAAHLLEKETIVDWAFQKNPDSIIWAVRSDGVLLGLTFQAEHQISAWHRHDTQGKFKALCAVPHGFEYSLFAVTERDGAPSAERRGEPKYYLERMAKHGCTQETTLSGEAASPIASAVYLDCSLTYAGNAPVRTISGLDHLEGKEVGILSQGAVEAPRVVRGGKITLDLPSNLVTVGLPYTADLETMPVETAGQQGSGIGLKKQISTVNIRFHESLGVKAGLSSEPGNLSKVKWQDVKWRVNEPYGQPPQPFSGVKHLTMPNLAENTLSVCIRSDLPTPVTVESIMARIEVKG